MSDTCVLDHVFKASMIITLSIRAARTPSQKSGRSVHRTAMRNSVLMTSSMLGWFSRTALKCCQVTSSVLWAHAAFQFDRNKPQYYFRSKTARVVYIEQSTSGCIPESSSPSVLTLVLSRRSIASSRVCTPRQCSIVGFSCINEAYRSHSNKN